ncbi:polyketide synthase [Chloropicon primus]|uniref:Polyketide synthase n=1 Tax=Chloropicon primus TaxID=1764295 RepID=A0A5B8MXQ7_9CHLO|nr:polyketide synthase [Chloropicon primus]QDZ25131.1 polyketide synthase [Chloropicon primus]QDZ25136.1 polyketide synthase [Chloropicon primus]UPR04338.1 polyketide synthase [Chloropicon primus]|eukprot:QDZ25128.1 polyketide synthase [Chloropicon primus]
MTRETPTRDTLPTSFFLFILSCRSTHVLHEPCSWRRLEGTIYTICIACVLGPLEDGSKQDTVMLRGTAVNQDGRSSALTAPHGPSQQQVMRMSLHSADLDAWSAQVLQMHGTGTPLGGPIEVGAASAVLLSEATKRDFPVHMSGVESNMGHSEAAAGMAGMVQLAGNLLRSMSSSHGRISTR